MPVFMPHNSALTREEVQSVQTRLASLGFDPGPVDGVYGPHTASAIVAFKRSKSLWPRPFIGPKTWELLHRDQAKSTPAVATETMGGPELPWIAELRRMVGLHEVKDNKTLRDWLASDGHALGDPSVYPWCGDAVETPLRLALPNEPIPKNPYWALNWRKWGVPTVPTYGCVISIERPSGGHVAFLVGQDEDRYYCLGGNQSNRISVAPIPKVRFTPDSFRWPSMYPRSEPKVPWMTSGAPSSQNEA